MSCFSSVTHNAVAVFSNVVMAHFSQNLECFRVSTVVLATLSRWYADLRNMLDRFTYSKSHGVIILDSVEKMRRVFAPLVVLLEEGEEGKVKGKLRVRDVYFLSSMLEGRCRKDTGLRVI